MKLNYLKHIAAVAVSAVIAFTSLGVFPFVNAETSDEQQTFTLSYNLSEEGLVAEDPSVFESIEVKAGNAIRIAEGDVDKEGLSFSGWTFDNIVLYQGNDVFKMPEHDVQLNAVWYSKDSEKHSVVYKAEYDGIVGDTALISKGTYRPGQFVSISLLSFERDFYEQHGWTDGENHFLGQAKMIMPDHDVVLEPYWLKYYNVYYEAGCEDRVVGNTSYRFEKLETLSIELANNDRLVRQGFLLSGWKCNLDDKIYPTLSGYVMPSSNVTFTAVWEPRNYTVVFKLNDGSSNTIKLQGKTDTAIIAPEPGSVKAGYKFAGWKYNDEIYQVGEEFIIPGAMPGLGIMLTGVWVEDNGDTDNNEETCDIFTLINARKDYVEGDISAEELKNIADFIVMRK